MRQWSQTLGPQPRLRKKQGNGVLRPHRHTRAHAHTALPSVSTGAEAPGSPSNNRMPWVPGMSGCPIPTFQETVRLFPLWKEPAPGAARETPGSLPSSAGPRLAPHPRPPPADPALLPQPEVHVLSRSPASPPPPAHTHTHRHTHTRAHSHIHTHSLSHTHAHTHSLTHMHTQTHTLTYI